MADISTHKQDDNGGSFTSKQPSTSGSKIMQIHGIIHWQHEKHQPPGWMLNEWKPVI